MKKYKKSSQLLGKKLMVYSAIMAGALTITSILVSCDKNNDNYKYETVEEIDSVDDNQPIILSENDLEKEYHQTLMVESDVDKAIKELHNIVIPALFDTDDPDLKQEMIDDNISIYLNSLQMVGDVSLIPEDKMEDYIMENYDISANPNMTHFFDEKVIIYNASAYKRLVDNNIDIYDALNEFNILMALQAYPTDLTEEEYYNLFPNLLKTIDLEKHENVYDIYFPLAYYIHRISCDDDLHYQDYNDQATIHCANIDNEYQKLMK